LCIAGSAGASAVGAYDGELAAVKGGASNLRVWAIAGVHRRTCIHGGSNMQEELLAAVT
jgi:hypothetical protein